MKRLMTDPEGLCCPISKQLMEDPVVAGDGFTYDRSTVEALFKHNGCSPPDETAIQEPRALPFELTLIDESWVRLG